MSECSKRIIAYILLLCVVAGLLMSGCHKEDTVNEPESNYDFSVFFGSSDDPMKVDTMLTEYAENTGIKINPIIISNGKDSGRALEALLKEADAPAAYAVSDDTDTKWLSKGGFIADFNTIDPKSTGESIPYVLDGYGLAYDRAVFEEIMGKDISDRLISDLRKATYGEWVIFVEALDSFINRRSVKEFSIGGNSYKFPTQKGKLSENLNGVFAIPGADSQIYGYNILNLAMQTADLPSLKKSEVELSGSAIEPLDSVLRTYINGLDLMTSYAAGEYGAGIRGSDFVDEAYYSSQRLKSVFMDGKAMFSIIDNREYGELYQLNAQKAQTLEYLPVKMPYDESLNRSIPAKVYSSLYVNAKSSEDIQKKALDFLSWYTERNLQLGDSLSASVRSYLQEGGVLQYEEPSEGLDDWKGEIFGEEGMEVFLKRAVWSEEYKDEIRSFLTKAWREN